MNNIRGSEWRRWDLHFHTPSSYDYKDKSISNEEIIDGLISNNISAVAITDHHVIDIDRVKDLQNISNGRVLILPGIEFRAELGGSETIHYIGIFPEDCDLDDIWRKIQVECSISEKDIQNRGHESISCDLKDTCRLIHQLGGLVTIHAGGKSNTIESIGNNHEFKRVLKKDIASDYIDILELGAEKDTEVYLNTVFPHTGLKLPLIICSDNHNIKNYEADVKVPLWIKADLSFQGLKQIVYEPDYRVKIQAEKPDYKEGKLVIDEVKFISSNKKFTDNTLCLNKNLNVIIGGKSSGKSILLYNIAKTLIADSQFFINEKIENKYDFKSEDENFNFEIKTEGGFVQRMYRDPSENSILPAIKYIPQNYLIKLAEPQKNKTGNALNNIVRDLINEEPEYREEYDAFLNEVKLNDRSRDNIIDNYFVIKSRVAELENSLKLMSNGEILKKNIEANTSKVEELNKSVGMTDEEIVRYNSLQRDLDENVLKKKRANNDYNKIKQFSNEIYQTIASLKNKQDLLSKSLENEDINKYFNNSFATIETLKQDTERVISELELANNWFKIESNISKVFDVINNERNDIEKRLNPYRQTDKIKEQIDTLLTSIKEDKSALQSIDQLKKEIDNNKRILKEEKGKLFTLYEENYKLYTRIIEKLKGRTKDLEKDGLIIKGIVKFNFPKFRKSIQDLSDGRTANYNDYKILDSHDSLAEYKLEDLLQELKVIFSDIVEVNKYALIKSADKRHAIKVLLDDYFFDYWEIEYKNDKLGKMSTGKASFIILMLIIGLSKSKAPILIDQPEDNLDNRSITSELVEYLKSKKLERQIILVTHNPNIVVNADAENIIVANQKGQGDTETSSPYQFDYINGALENTFTKKGEGGDLLKSMGIKEHIAEIVEGGKEAFRKREEKYGFT